MNFIPERFGDPRTKRAANSSRHQILGDVLVTATAAITAGRLANLRVRTLAKVAGCSVGSILGVFPDLDALTLAVNARTLGEIDRTMAAAGDDDPAEHLVRLSRAYLDYASEHRHRWAALFHHTMPEGQTAPTWYTAQQAASFSHLEAPPARLRADLAPADGAMLARTLFSAVHGMVALGLDEKVAVLPSPVLINQVESMVRAIARGLAA